MRRFDRLPEPEFLTDKWEAWGLEWERRSSEGQAFYWHQVDGEPVNRRLMPFLKTQTQDHCSFCDNYPVSPPSLDTIEHFKPKSKYPREAYKWTNLYFCCVYCQQKSDAFNEAALQPDAEDYSFERYFRWDWTLGTLEVNERATPKDQARAKATIELYNLNKRHPALRKRALHQRAKDADSPLDDFAYRDYVSAPPEVA
jgi:uncharacterized protein (TIGR02646 family)